MWTKEKVHLLVRERGKGWERRREIKEERERRERERKGARGQRGERERGRDVL